MSFPITVQVCWMCGATKGNRGDPADLHMAYTNTGCHWRSTLYQDQPFDAPAPALTRLEGFTTRMVHPDILHVWHLGTGRDLLGSALVVLVKHRYFPGRTIARRLAAASRSLCAYAKAHKLYLARRSLTKKSLNWESGQFPELRTKGYDTYIIGRWLASELEANDPGMPDLCTAVWTSNNCLSVMANSKGYFLTPMEQEQIILLGSLFCDTYLRLAHNSILNGNRLWRIRPKYHLVQHLFMVAKVSRLNMHKYSTWIDEDGNKKFMRINRATHRRTAAIRVLQRWLLGLPQTFAKLAK